MNIIWEKAQLLEWEELYILSGINKIRKKKPSKIRRMWVGCACIAFTQCVDSCGNKPFWIEFGKKHGRKFD